MVERQDVAQSRRSILAAAAGALVAATDGVLGRASPVCADGETVKVGDVYTTADTFTVVFTGPSAADCAFSWLLIG